MANSEVPHITMNSKIQLGTYECPLCRSVGNVEISTPGEPRVPVVISCPVCQAGIVMSQITTQLSFHYSIPIKALNN